MDAPGYLVVLNTTGRRDARGPSASARTLWWFPGLVFSVLLLCLCVFLETHYTRSADLGFLRLGRFPVRKAFGFPVCSFKAAEAWPQAA